MSRPSVEFFLVREMPNRTFHREILIARTPVYAAKILLMKAGDAGGLQYHVDKDETFFLDEGQAWVDYDAGDGTLTRLVMSTGMSIHVPAGAPHRVTAITACKFFEISTPHVDDRVRVEPEYGEPEVGGLPTTR